MRFRDQLLDDDIQHCTGGGGQQPRHRGQLRGDEDDRNAEKRFYDAAQCAVDKVSSGSGLPDAAAARGAFGEVLYADAERERTGRRDQSPAAAVLCGAMQTTGRRPFLPGILCRVTASTSSVVRRNEDGSPSARAAPLCRCGSEPSSSSMSRMPRRKPPDAGSHPTPPACSGLLDRRDEQAPDRCCDHYSAAKPRKMRCISAVDFFFHKKYHRRTEGRHREREARTGCGLYTCCIVYFLLRLV